MESSKVVRRGVEKKLVRAIVEGQGQESKKKCLFFFFSALDGHGGEAIERD